MSNPKYINHPSFPASAPLNHPHILDPSTTDTSAMRLCDAIATLFYHLEAKYPGTLKAFFDMSTEEIKFIRTFKEEQPGGKSEVNLVIWRIGSHVLAGLYSMDNNRLEWKGVTRSTISPSDQWTTVWAARSACSWPPLEHLARSKFSFSGVNMPSFMKKDPYDPVERTELPNWLASMVWTNKLWEETHDAVFRVEIK